jgi:hypothetical protein
MLLVRLQLIDSFRRLPALRSGASEARAVLHGRRHSCGFSITEG